MLIRYKHWVVLGACLFAFVMSYIPFGSCSIYLVNRIGWVIERLPAFIFGMYIASNPISSKFTKYLVGGGVLPLMVCVVLRITGHGRVIYLILLLALPMLCVIVSILAHWLKCIKLDGVVEYFGKTSLELYLWHEFIFLNLHSNAMFTDLSIWVKFIIAFGASILLAHFTHILIQRVPRLLE